MRTAKFTGKVLPAVIQASFDSIPETRWVAEEFNATWDFKISISASTIEVEIALDRFEDAMLVHLYKRSFYLVRACTDVASFATGYSMSAYLDKFVRPDGTVTDLFLTDPNLPPLVTAFRFPTATQQDRTDFGKILVSLFSEPPLFMALNDLIESISLPHHAPVACARALDGIRNLLAPGATPKQGWPLVQSTLHADEKYLRLITEHSKGPRHGDRAHIPGNVIGEITKRSWILMNRFLEFRKRGNQPLPQSEFPLLAG